MSSRLHILFAVVLTCLSPAASAQQEEEDPPAKGAEPATLGQVKPNPVPVTLPENGFHLRLSLATNLAKGHAAKPIALTPDIEFALTDSITVAVIHSGRAIEGIYGDFGAFCLSGKNSGCPDVYPRGGAEARIELGALSHVGFAMIAGAIFEPDPFALSVKGGLLVRTENSDFYGESRPVIFVAANERDNHPDRWVLPLDFGVFLESHTAIGVETGLTSTFESPGDSYAVPLSVVGTTWLTPSVGASLVLTLPVLIGDDSQQTGFDNRSVTLSVMWRNRYTEVP